MVLECRLQCEVYRHRFSLWLQADEKVNHRNQTNVDQNTLKVVFPLCVFSPIISAIFVSFLFGCKISGHIWTCWL